MERERKKTGREIRERNKNKLGERRPNQWRRPPKPVREEATVKAGRYVRQCATVRVRTRVCMCAELCNSVCLAASLDEVIKACFL